MSGTHPTREEDFDLYALGALDGDEKAALEAHLPSCAPCQAKLAEASGRMAMLALVSPSVIPSPGVRERLMQQVAATAARPSGNARVVPERSEGIFARWWGLLIPVAAAFALATLVLWLHNAQLDRQLADLRGVLQQQQTELAQARDLVAQQEAQLAQARDVADMMSSRDTVVVSLAEQKNQPEGTARVIYNAKRGLLVYNGHLAPITSDKSYQLWLVPTNGAPISAGIFNPVAGQSNSIVAKVPPGTSAKAFAVTLEPAGGKPAPTGPMILVGPVS